jgi:molybdenum cofactor guanylyltransferase
VEDAKAKFTNTSKRQITACILAGGRARRMGGEDKGLLTLSGKPMISYIVDALRPQVGEVIVNANRNHQAYEAITGCRVIKDIRDNFPGPLAGMASVMQAAKTPYVLTVPCDSPLIAPDLSARLHQSLEQEKAEVSVAYGAGRLQPVFALLRAELLESILTYLDAGEGKIDTWYATRHMVETDFSDRSDMFLNVNHPEDCADIQTRMDSLLSCP